MWMWAILTDDERRCVLRPVKFWLVVRGHLQGWYQHWIRLPNIEKARVLKPGIVELVWSTGETFNADLTDLPKLNPAYAKLATQAFFNRVKRDEWGRGIGWHSGLDLGADRLYGLCREQAGLPTASEFEAWMELNSLTLSGAAESLGMTRRMIAYYRAGSKPIPKVVGLACKGWETRTS